MIYKRINNIFIYFTLNNYSNFKLFELLITSSSSLITILDDKILFPLK